MKKKLIVVLCLIFILLSMNCVSAGLFDGLFGNNEKNITLTNVTTKGWCNSYDNGDVSSVYEIDGILHDLPNNINDYEINVTIYDENGDLIKEDLGYSLQSIARASDRLESSLLGMVIIEDFKNVSNIEIKIYDDNDSVIFSENTTFNMDNVKINYLTKDISSSDDDSIQPMFKTHTKEEQRELDNLYDKYLANNA